MTGYGRPCVICNQRPCECWRQAQEAERDDLMELFEPTRDGIIYVAAMNLAEAKVRLELTERILDRILEKVRAELDG